MRFFEEWFAGGITDWSLEEFRVFLHDVFHDRTLFVCLLVTKKVKLDCLIRV